MPIEGNLRTYVYVDGFNLYCRPDGQVPGGFKNVVSFVRHITLRRLAAAQMSNPVSDKRRVNRPSGRKAGRD